MKKERIQQILNDLQSLRVLSTVQAAERYNTSRATIRRSFNELAASGLALRTHGGIRFLEQEVPSVPYGLREEWNIEEKKAIAQEAVKYIRDSHSVMIYGGSTTGHLGFYLTQGRIITNLPDLCRILRMRFPTGDGPQVILTGGEFDFRTGNLEGPALRRSLENYECDVGVASAYGVDETGLIDISDECSEQIALMLGKSSLRIILADHSKFKRKGFCRSLPWNRIHILITTFDPENHAVIKSAQSQGVKVVFVSVPDRNHSPR